MTQARVLRVITRLNVGGPALHVGILSARLDGTRFGTVLVTGRQSHAEGDMRALGRFAPDVRIRQASAMRRRISPVLDPIALLQVIRIVHAFRPHIVHTHLAKAGFTGRVAARLAASPVVLHTYHGSVFQGYFGPRTSRAYLMVERALGRISTRLIAITAGQRAELASLGVASPDRIVTVPLGLDLAQFVGGVDRSSARRSLGIDAEDGPVIGVVARLVPVKDIGTFLRAIRLVADRRGDIRAVVVGDGEERARLEGLASQLGISKRCTFLGWRSDMPTVYGALDVLALTSLNEGSPVALIEGMAAAVPIVATAVGGVPDLIRHERTGLLVSPREPQMVADAIDRLLSDDRLSAHMRMRGRDAALRDHDAARLVRDIEALYGQLLGSAAG